MVINFVLFMLVFSVHELGHALAMRKHGLRLQEITLFGFGPKLLSFKLTRWFGDTPVYIRAIPLLAYVQVDDRDADKLAKLNYQATAEVYGAGVHANLVYAFMLLAFWLVANSHENPKIWLFGGGLLLATLLFAWLRPWVCAYLFPWLLPVIVLILILPPIVTDSNQGVQGPLTILSGTAHNIATQSSLTFIPKMIDLSVGLGLFNLIPLHPFDGGKLFEAIMKAVLPSNWHTKINQHMTATLAVLGFVLAISILGIDVWHMLERVFTLSPTSYDSDSGSLP
jgi:membrane-associated protease RseP (regulator of RpoE activity)